MSRLALSALIILLSVSCKKNPPDINIDPIFQEKKRLPYNEAMMAKVPTDDTTGYQEVDANFANAYQDTQDKFASNHSKDIFTKQNKDIKNVATDDPLTVQKIRDDAKQMKEIDEAYQQVATSKDYHNDDTSSSDGITASDLQPKMKSKLSVNDNSVSSAYELQAGAYRNKNGAQTIVQKLQQSGIENIRIEKINDHHVIKITSKIPLRTRAEASEFLQNIIDQSQHYDIMVIHK